MRTLHIRSTRSILFTLGALFGASAGCSEPTRPESNPNPPPVVAEPLPPVAYVGPNISLPFPFQSLELTGYALATESPIARYSWTKVSGPGSYFVGSPDVQRPEVAGLDKGTCVFELTVFVGTRSTWVEAKPEREWTPDATYMYGFHNGTFLVHTNDASGTVDLRVVY